MSGFDRAVKVLVWERDGGHCVRCGVSSFTNCDIHHRRRRGMGTGERAEWINEHPNLLLLCRGCHDWIEEHRESSQEAGWLLREGQDPEEVGVLYYDGVIYRLHGYGFRTPAGLGPVFSGASS